MEEIEKIMENIVYYNNLAKPNKVLHLWKILKELQLGNIVHYKQPRKAKEKFALTAEIDKSFGE